MPRSELCVLGTRGRSFSSDIKPLTTNAALAAEELLFTPGQRARNPVVSLRQGLLPSSLQKDTISAAKFTALSPGDSLV